LHIYGPATVGDFGDWAGIAKAHAERRWQHAKPSSRRSPWAVTRAGCFATTRRRSTRRRRPKGIRLLPPGDPYLAKPNRPLLAPAAELRTRLFRPIASPGAVLEDGRLAGLWRVKAKGAKAEIAVEKLRPIARTDLEQEAQRVAELRGASGVVLTWER